MDTGVTLSRQEPLFASTFTRRSDGIVEERRVNAKAGKLRVKTTYYHGGLFPLEMKIRGGATLRTRTVEGSTLPPLPFSPGEYEISEVTYADGKPFAESTLRVSVRDAFDSVSIKDCRFETRKIRVSSDSQMPGAELKTYFEYDYSVELGIVIRSVEFVDAGFAIPKALIEYDKIAADGL